MDWPTYLARGVTGVVTPAALEALYDRGFVVLDGVLGATHAGAVAADAEAMSAAGALSPAKVTTGVSQRVEPSKRSDSIAWLKRPRGGGAGGAPAPALPPAISRHLSAVGACAPSSRRAALRRRALQLHARRVPGRRRAVRAAPRRGAARLRGPQAHGHLLSQRGMERSRRRLPAALAARRARRARRRRALDGAEGGDAEGDGAEGDGAEGDGEVAPPVAIAPLADRLLIFESRLSHEVLPWNVAPEAGRARRAITAWLYDPKELALELLVEQSGLRADAQAAGKGGGSDRAALVLKLMAMRQQRGGAVYGLGSRLSSACRQRKVDRPQGGFWCIVNIGIIQEPNKTKAT